MSDNASNHSQSSKGGSMQITTTDEEFTIRVLTLNCWGLWLGAKKRRQRMTNIVKYLREKNCDIVFLQEVWVTSDFENIRQGTNDIYRFAHLYRSGSVLGSSGIVILCRWLPKVIHFEPYSLNGSPFYPWHGDWFAGKGIAYSRVDFDGLSLHLFSTHTHAYYKKNEPVHDQYSVHRVCQSYQLARFITFISDTACNRSSSGKDLLIVAGDMNSTSTELPYKILTTMAGLTDCFKTSRHNHSSSNIIHKHKMPSHKQDSSTSSSNSSQGGEKFSLYRSKLSNNFILETLEGIRNKVVPPDSDTEDEDITYCHPKNSFTYESSMKRIDFILCRLLTHGHCVVDRIATEKNTDLECSLSDHEPVMVELKISDVSHDLMDKNHITNLETNIGKSPDLSESCRSLASVVESKVSISDASQIEETTNQWVPEEVPMKLSYKECNVQVLKSTQEVLMQYHQYNRSSKTQLFYIILFMFIITLPTTTYYAISNELLPISTIVFMWLAASFFFAVGLLIGFLSYRFEQGAIEAILNDITCRISVYDERNKFSQF